MATSNTPSLTLLPRLVPRPLWGISGHRKLARSKWEQIRKVVIAEAHGACEVCGEKREKGMIVDEVWSYIPGQAFLSGLRLICPPCNDVTHAGNARSRGVPDELLVAQAVLVAASQRVQHRRATPRGAFERINNPWTEALARFCRPATDLVADGDSVGGSHRLDEALDLRGVIFLEAEHRSHEADRQRARQLADELRASTGQCPKQLVGQATDLLGMSFLHGSTAQRSSEGRMMQAMLGTVDGEHRFSEELPDL